jgi:hypothetical protein
VTEGVALTGERSSMSDVAASLLVVTPRRIGADGPASLSLADHFLPIA